MNKKYTAASVSIRIWLFTAMAFAILCFCYFLLIESFGFNLFLPFIALLAALLGSVPVLIGMLIIIPFINLSNVSWRTKLSRLIFLLFILCIPYGIAGAVLNILTALFGYNTEAPVFIITAILIAALLFTCSLAAALLALRPIYAYFNNNKIEATSTTILNQLFSYTTKIKKMETQQNYAPAPQQSNKILIKGIITGALILIMLIPTIFIYNLIEEREARQKEVVKEVSSKWATAQTLSAPFLVVPYTDTFLNSEGKTVAVKTKLLLLANELAVNGKIIPEQRPRSIYKVLLYKTSINMDGAFKIKWPTDINLSNVDYANAKLCFSLSDFKGIEEEIYINFNGQKLLLTPGLPVDDFGAVGLSVPVSLSPEASVTGMPFSMQVKLKGSEQLHFIPMSAS
ncbi:MAG TPA: inner membrane CreD family protein, partial [Ferruginibacter sp.]|nr:inner membrane CreD family protein [Ferruginibacter sp.]